MKMYYNSLSLFLLEKLFYKTALKSELKKNLFTHLRLCIEIFIFIVK